MTATARVPLQVPTLTEVVSWSDSAQPTAWMAPTNLPPDLARDVEARVMHQIQQLLPGLVAQALLESLQDASAKDTDN